MVGSISSASQTVSPYLAGGRAALQAQSTTSTASGSTSGTARSAAGARTLSPGDQELLTKLKARDSDVRAHEQAHRSVGGQYASAPSYTFQKGPDGANYAIGGEVSIDTSPITGNINATIAKEAQVQAAALAPADPSGQDLKVAAEAATAIAQAEASRTSNGHGNAQPGNAAAGAGATAGSITATAADAQSGSGFTALFARGISAYQTAAGLGSGGGRASGTAAWA